MKVLFDTNILIFAAEGRITDDVRQFFDNEDCEKYFSAASIWEMVIKSMIHRLTLGVPIEALEERMVLTGIKKLNIETRHIYGVQRLKDVNNDPFDRLLVSQALEEGLEFITSDKRLEEYAGCVRFFPKRQ